MSKKIFSNEVKNLKEEFKNLIASMPDYDFLYMLSILMFDEEDMEDDFESDDFFDDDDLPF